LNFFREEQVFFDIAHNSACAVAIVLRLADAPLSWHIFGEIDVWHFFAKKHW